MTVDLVALKGSIGLADYIGRYVKLTRRGTEHVGLCPFHDEKSPSFTVSDGKGFYHCFGCQAHGDVIDFVVAYDNLSKGEAIRRLAQDAGFDDPVARAQAARREANRQRRALREYRSSHQDAKRYAAKLWSQAVPIDGTLVETYLNARSIDPDQVGPLATLRFLARQRHVETDQYLPVMLAAVQRLDGAPYQVHRTFLRPNGQGKAEIPHAKKLLAGWLGGTTHFGRPVGETLAIAEGIETALSVLQSLRAHGHDLAVWATLTLGNMFDVPLPPGVKGLAIFADNDQADLAKAKLALDRAAARYRKKYRLEKVAIVMPPPGQDFNDVIRDELPEGVVDFKRARRLFGGAAVGGSL